MNIRLQLNEYFAATGKLPSTNKELNLPSPVSFSDEVLQSLEIQVQGVIGSLLLKNRESKEG